MKLPNRENAVVPREKLVDYLLCETHPVGRGKAKFFRSYGYNENNVDVLEHGLLELARLGDVDETETKPSGDLFAIEGSLETPIGAVIQVRSVWFIENGTQTPRLVTAYPAGKKGSRR